MKCTNCRELRIIVLAVDSPGTKWVKIEKQYYCAAEKPEFKTNLEATFSGDSETCAGNFYI